MFKEIFTSMSGVEIYPIAALILFFGFFLALIVWVVSLDRKHVEHMAQLPIESKAGEEGNGREGSIQS